MPSVAVHVFNAILHSWCLRNTSWELCQYAPDRPLQFVLADFQTNPTANAALEAVIVLYQKGKLQVAPSGEVS